MISGSYTGGISFFKGEGNGKYAAAQKLLNKQGNPLSDEYAQTPCLGDWDGDGDWDMVIGFITGPAKLFLNGGKMDFKEAGTLKLNGKDLNASDGGPCITDWDGDGKLDLLMGDGEGGVRYYQTKSKGSLELLAGEPLDLIAPLNPKDSWTARKLDPKSPSGLNLNRPGVRTKPFAADWNSDGKLDLLVGDYFSVETKAMNLTLAEKTELARLEKAQQVDSTQYQKEYERNSAKALKQIGKKSLKNLSQADMKRYGDAYLKLYKNPKVLEERNRRSMALYTKINALKPRDDSAGYVWVYLRK